MLRVERLCAAYGRIVALREVSLTVEQGQFVAVIGPNGAGKTTLFKCISGTVTPTSGRILLDGRDIGAIEPAERAQLGIAHVPEGRQVFRSLSVIENLEMGAMSAAGRAFWSRNLERILDLFPVLAERRGQLAGTLSGGEQQMLAIGRGLASSPKLLLLDEPSMGLAPRLTETIFDRIEQIHREDGVTVLLVEQRVVEALQPCDWAYVLETGECVLDGPPATLLKNDRVKRAYLGF